MQLTAVLTAVPTTAIVLCLDRQQRDSEQSRARVAHVDPPQRRELHERHGAAHGHGQRGRDHAIDGTSDTATDSDTSVVLPEGTVPFETALFEMDSEADFSALFPDAIFGTSLGFWRFDDGASTQSADTGPGTNNVSPFVHTETTSSVQATVESNGIADFGSVPDQVLRILRLRLSIQGLFGDGTEGLQIQHRASGTDAWSEAGFVYGWDYQELRTRGYDHR